MCRNRRKGVYCLCSFLKARGCVSYVYRRLTPDGELRPDEFDVYLAA